MLKAVIIGAGGIGAFYDSPAKGDPILTHAHAYRSVQGIRLEGFYDQDFKKTRKAAQRWRSKAFTSLDDLMDAKPDLVSVCVPDQEHEKIIRKLVSYKPKAIFCEKPLAMNPASAQTIVNVCNKNKILLAVNYTRRWCPEIIELKKHIAGGRFGKALNAVCFYTKGVRHNGSHMIDLLQFFFGGVLDSKTLAVKYDFSNEDPTVDAFLKMEQCPAVHLAAGDSRAYSLFEMDLLFEKKRITLSQSGRRIHFSDIKTHPQIAGFKILSDFSTQKTQLQNSLLYAVSNIADTLKGKTALGVSSKDPVETQRICAELIRQARKLKK